MPARLLHRRLTRGCAAVRRFYQRLVAATRPATAPVAAGALVELVRGRPALLAEHALLRHQLAVLRRSVKRPRYTPGDRALLVLPAGRVRTWRHAPLIVQPGTRLR